MFLDNLSAALLRFCAARSLSYEEVAERCRISPRYSGEIVRKHTSPTLRTLEKICAGLDVTPNDLLLRRAGLDGPRGGHGRRPGPRRRRSCAAS